MTTALQAAEQHLAALAANGVPAKDKPSAFHHGLITQLVEELKRANARLPEKVEYYECGEGYARPIGQRCTGQCVLRG